MSSTFNHYADDAPISTPVEDRFGRWPFAARIARVLATRTDASSLVVGIYGPWGDGKTSVLNLMAAALEPQSHIVCVTFNPWHFEEKRVLVRAFFETLASALAPLTAIDGGELTGLLQRYGATVSLGTAPASSAAVDGPVANAATNPLSNTELDAMKGAISALLARSGKRIVVLVDDVDRLPRSGIHTVLKVIKLSASFSNTAYVLAIDADVVSASLGERYGDGGAEAGQQFLEKIIQVPLHLPDAEIVDLQAACLQGVDEVVSANSAPFSDDDVETFVRHFTSGVMPALHTPRQVKRYLNAIRFAVPMLTGEVHVVDQLLVEGMRSVYPRVYLCVRDNGDVFTGERLGAGTEDAEETQAARAIIEAGLQGLASAQREGALNLLKALFPRLNAVYSNITYGPEWNETWAAERRIASLDYFRRYFQYTVPARDVGDADVAAFIEACQSGRLDLVDAFFASVSTRDAWTLCFHKLSASLAALDVRGSGVLTRALAVRAASIPREAGRFSSILSADRQAAVLIARLVTRGSDAAARTALAVTVVSESTSLPLAADCLRLLSQPDEESGAAAALDSGQRVIVGGILARRIASLLPGEPTLVRHGSDTGTLLSAWKTYGAPGAVAEFLTRRFTDRPEEIVRLLDALVGLPTSREHGGARDGGFGRNEYDLLADLIDPGLVVEFLERRFGALRGDVTLETMHDAEGDVRTARQFVAIDHKARQERASHGDRP